eukprot:SAG31_NODE_8895_length_1367_cov_1.370662_2_plen_154_part_00
MLGQAFCEWMVRTHAMENGDLWDMLEVFGDCATWGAHSPIDLVKSGKASAALSADASSSRLWLGGQHFFGPMPCSTNKKCVSGTDPAPGAPFNHTIQFHAALEAARVTHSYNNQLDPGKHEWSWLWLEAALQSFGFNSTPNSGVLTQEGKGEI